MSKIIITADDYGMSQATNDAIAEAIRAGTLLSTNIMVNMDYFQQAKELMINYPEVSFGIHLNLTTGKPIANPSLISSIVDSNGYFYNSTEFRSRLNKGLIDLRHVANELSHQTKKYIVFFGNPSYWNSHENIHINLKLFKTFIKTTKSFEIFNMRNHLKYVISSKQSASSLKLFPKNVVVALLMLYARIHGMKMPSGSLVFSPYESRYDMGVLIKSLSNVNKTYEFYLHPSKLIDSEYFGNIIEGRLREYTLLVDPANIEKLKLSSLEITNFITSKE